MEIRYLNEPMPLEAGGKARGLAELFSLGLPVPEGFVIITPRPEALDPVLLLPHLETLGPGPKAVRSSAVAEDGAAASFAGQLETYLNVEGAEEIFSAIGKCIGTARSSRVKAYAASRDQSADMRVSVIVQKMCIARCAGVLFTADPVTGRRDRLIINAVSGLGEKLVSGHVDATHYAISRDGKGLAEAALKGNQLLAKTELAALLTGALAAEARAGHPVDIEWAVELDGTLRFLQLRPVTALSTVHYNELDTTSGSPEDIYTLGNIGEMMPGAITPLTFSVTARAIEHGMRYFAAASGALPKNTTGFHYIAMFYNRLFFNVTSLYDFNRYVLMNTKENVELSVVGCIVPGTPAAPAAWWLRRAYNFFKQLTALLQAGSHLKKIHALEKKAATRSGETVEELYAALSLLRDDCADAFAHHMIVSAHSGSLYSALISVINGNKRTPTSVDHRIASALLSDIPEIVGADAVRSLEALAGSIAADANFTKKWLAADEQATLPLLRESASPVQEQFACFLADHGHRCIKESELREKPWREEPEKLVKILRLGVKAGKVRRKQDHAAMVATARARVTPVGRLVLRFLLPAACKAVAQREEAKSHSIKVFDAARKNYHKLAQLLVAKGHLDDTDQIFFLTHEEIGTLLHLPNPDLLQKALARRIQQPQLEALRFPDITNGVPFPAEAAEALPKTGELCGIPVSIGTVTAPARIVRTLAEADSLQAGEIMVAVMTDVGWTPYFSLIAGLITEIGSPLSHGAVVAREYGIPAMVSVKGATHLLSTGDIITLDATTGLIQRHDIRKSGYNILPA